VVIMLLGGFATSETVAMAKRAAEAGADAVAVLPPLMYEPTVESIIERLTILTEAAGLPIIYYHYPHGTHVDLDASELIEIVKQVPNLLGIKFADRAFPKALAVKAAMPETHLLPGAEELLLAGLVLGAADGTVSSGVTFMPDAAVEVYRAFERSDFEAARVLSHRIAITSNVCGQLDWTTGAYAICNLLGFEVGRPRSPVATATAGQIDQLHSQLVRIVGDAPFREKRLITAADLLGNM